jgi:AraC-like DNA-binding protein
MQPRINLKLSAEMQKKLSTLQSGQADAIIASAIQQNAEQIGFMLQEYYPREKVRRVEVVPGSLKQLSAVVTGLTIAFTLEEFNACSAINTEDRKQMPVTVEVDVPQNTLSLKGEYWPEA